MKCPICQGEMSGSRAIMHGGRRICYRCWEKACPEIAAQQDSLLKAIASELAFQKTCAEFEHELLGD